MTTSSALRPCARMRACASLLGVAAAFPAAAAESSFVDKVADVMAIIVLIVVPVVVIVLFWMVHVLPEKIAHKRHHPQRDAITTLCLLSLVFGGLLWPLAWLWAYTKPVGYRSAYGTDKHMDYYEDMAERHRAGTLLRDDLRHLREDLEAMEAKGALPPQLRALKDELNQLRYEAQAQAQADVQAGQKGGA
ncbi:DUF3302 domain-containing protein [Variovorax sp.]|uniref:DUF3302 domain-containing protein n=1 Tax=Variovorax sp. TaxID=1871043 RepID=UPI002D311107|nr:DUF3302 domain-containing protein [Variovorax sp.]HYP83311.1 DUF3302 domain-containing protein [Variovorax sp.]